MKRRELLQAISAGPFVGVPPGEDTERRGQSLTAVSDGIDDCNDQDGISLRCLGEQLDPARPATRLGGFGPPELRDGTAPQREQYYTPVRPETWSALGQGDLDDRRERRVRRHARDLGMTHRHQKGLLELHRYRMASTEGSVRAVADRYQNGNRFKLLFFNAALFPAGPFTQHPDIEQRTAEIGRMLYHRGYDIVGLNEVWLDDQQERLLDNVAGTIDPIVWWGSPPGNDNVQADNNGLLTLLLDNGSGTTPKQTRESYGYYDRLDSYGSDLAVAKGWHRTEIDLGPGKIDFFVTHLNHGQDSALQRIARMEQVDTLIAGIRNHTRPENVTVVCGDFNAIGNRAEYGEMIERLDNQLNLQDVWLTRGGRVARTSWYADEHPLDLRNPDWPWDCPDYANGCVCDPYPQSIQRRDADDVVVDRNARLDYVFVEKPKPSHDLTIDIKRVRRKLFPRHDPDHAGSISQSVKDCSTPMVECPHVAPSEQDQHCNNTPYLSDHMGLELEILAS